MLNDLAQTPLVFVKAEIMKWLPSPIRMEKLISVKSCSFKRSKVDESKLKKGKSVKGMAKDLKKLNPRSREAVILKNKLLTIPVFKCNECPSLFKFPSTRN